MSDLISRQAAIAHLKKRLIETAINNTGVRALCDSIFADTADNRIEPWINELPSVDVEPVKQGKWVDYKRMQMDGTFYWYRSCSECGYEREDDDWGKDTPYCPNCGAKMEPISASPEDGQEVEE